MFLIRAAKSRCVDDGIVRSKEAEEECDGEGEDERNTQGSKSGIGLDLWPCELRPSSFSWFVPRSGRDLK